MQANDYSQITELLSMSDDDFEKVFRKKYPQIPEDWDLDDNFHDILMLITGKDKEEWE